MQYLVPLLLGLAHGVADGSVGMQLGSLNGTVSFERIGLLVLLYNLLAFGSQPLVGLVIDRLRAPRGAVLLGLACHCAALLLSHAAPAGAVVLAGIGSAAFHVGGGALALCATSGRAVGPGLFAAPGVVDARRRRLSRLGKRYGRSDGEGEQAGDRECNSAPRARHRRAPARMRRGSGAGTAWSSNSSASFSVITPASSSASVTVTARR